MSRFDEEPDGDPHGECALEIASLQGDNARLREELATVRAQSEIHANHCRVLLEELAEAKANYQFMVDRAANEKLDGYRELGTKLAAAEQRAEQAESRALAAEKDAGRYRWLRDKSVPPHNFYLSVPVEFADEKYTQAQVDSAIDAAIGAKHD